MLYKLNGQREVMKLFSHIIYVGKQMSAERNNGKHSDRNAPEAGGQVTTEDKQAVEMYLRHIKLRTKVHGAFFKMCSHS